MLIPTRQWSTAFLVAIVAAILFFASAPARVQAEGAQIGLPQVECHGDTATVTFTWAPIQGGVVQWLDLSAFDNGFAPDSFIGAGPYRANENQVVWSGLVPDMAHFWRINTLTADGWVASETGAFVPCGGPVLRWGPLTCLADGTARVDFRWAPALPAASQQWLDFSDQNNGFVAETYFATGPMHGTINGYTVQGFTANVPWVFRVNALTEEGWRETETAGFMHSCEPLT